MNYKKEILEKMDFIRLNQSLIKSPIVRMQNIRYGNCLSKSVISQFEKQHSVILPDDYKYFLSEIGNGGFGPGYGLRTLEESIIDFKLNTNPVIMINQPFKYTEEWNEQWIENIDWEENDRPSTVQVEEYMDVNHISGCLQIVHYGHGCTYLLIINGIERGHIWFDGRADYGGLSPELDEKHKKLNFIDWYMQWLDSEMEQLSSNLV